jgi:hypothetical protein
VNTTVAVLVSIGSYDDDDDDDDEDEVWTSCHRLLRELTVT